MKRPEIGDIVLAAPSSESADQTFQYVVVLDLFDAGASCVLATLRTDLAIEIDLILPTEVTLLSAPVVVHSMTGCQIPYTRLSRTFASCGIAIADDIFAARLGDSSGRFEAGQPALLFGDHREDQLTSIYSQFFEMFHITEAELAKSKAIVEAPTALDSQIRMNEAIRRVQDQTATAEQRQLVRERLDLMDQRDSVSDIDFDEEFKILIGNPAVLASNNAQGFELEFDNGQ